MKNLVFTFLIAFMFTSPVFADSQDGHKKKGECRMKYMCKEKKGSDKISCWADRLTCQKNKKAESISKLKAVSKDKLAKRKAKRLTKTTEQLTKSNEKIKKVEAKIGEIKVKLAKPNLKDKRKTKLTERLKMKEARLTHIKARIEMLNDHKSQLEALN